VDELSVAKYRNALDKYTSAGYRLTQVDSYRHGDAVRYSAVFTKTTGPAWKSYQGVSATTHQANYDAYTSHGYVPINVSVVVVNGARYYTALYEQASVGSFKASSTVLESGFQTYLNEQTAAGRKLTYIDVYRDGTVNRFSVVFASDVGSNWSSIHSATTTQYESVYDSNRSAGLLTRAVAAYASSGLKYDGLWRE
jgi:hypothetical protein